MSLSSEKSLIRTALLRQRESLESADVTCLGSRAQLNLIESPGFQAAMTLALYSPIRNEVATDRLSAVALNNGKRICYPCVVGDELCFYSVNAYVDLQPGRFGIHEPDQHSERIGLDQIDLLLLPGVAFDRRGFRLGYGRGYFDRYLASGRFNGIKVGLAYDFQVLDQLPAEGHDQRVDLLVTELGIIFPSGL